MSIWTTHGTNLIAVIRSNANDAFLQRLYREARDGRYARRDVDSKQLRALDKYQRRYLSNYVCGECDYPLDRPGCGAYGGAPPCHWRARIRRRANCLKRYRPRLSRRKAA